MGALQVPRHALMARRGGRSMVCGSTLVVLAMMISAQCFEANAEQKELIATELLESDIATRTFGTADSLLEEKTTSRSAGHSVGLSKSAGHSKSSNGEGSTCAEKELCCGGEHDACGFVNWGACGSCDGPPPHNPHSHNPHSHTPHSHTPHSHNGVTYAQHCLHDRGTYDGSISTHQSSNGCPVHDGCCPRCCGGGPCYPGDLCTGLGFTNGDCCRAGGMPGEQSKQELLQQNITLPHGTTMTLELLQAFRQRTGRKVPMHAMSPEYIKLHMGEAAKTIEAAGTNKIKQDDLLSLMETAVTVHEKAGWDCG